MHVYYDHPPRTLGFYIRYVLLLLITILPILVIVPLWTASLTPLWIVGLVIGSVMVRLLSVVKPMLVTHIIVEDIGIPKDLDISHLELPVADSLADIVVQLEMEGFERFGEYESYVAGQERPVPVWMYRSARGQIIVQLTEIGQPPAPYVGFTTFTEKGVVETDYPRGHQLKLPQARFSGVRSDVLAAYRHHIEQVREFIATGERVLNVESVEQFQRLDGRYAPLFKARSRHSLFDRVVAETFLTLGLVPGSLFIPTWFVPKLYSQIFVGNRLYHGFLMLVIGLTVPYIINWRSRGVKGPKQLKPKPKKEKANG